MTDNEIKKALGSEIHLAEYVDSDYCSNVNLEIIKSALDLINRQQAEIDEMKHEREVLIEDIHHSADKINEQLEEIERLKAEEEKYPFKCVMPFNSMVCSKSIEDYDRLVGDIGAEAIKEFAEHLKEEWFNNYYDSPDVDFYEFVDNLLKEMVGEE